MSSTATSRLRLDKQATGDNPNAWGVRLNAVEDLIDEAFGVTTVSVSADVTLSSNNFTSDQARRTVLQLTGPGGFNVIIPSVDKAYFIDNGCTNPVTIKTALDAGVSVRPGTFQWVYSTGTAVRGAMTVDAAISAAAALASANAAAASAAAAALFDPSTYYSKTASDTRFALAANSLTPGQIAGRIIALAGA